MPLCWGGACPEVGSASFHCKTHWILLTLSCCWAAKSSQHPDVPHGISLMPQWQHSWVAVVTAETCSTDETCRGAALQALVIFTGLGTGPGKRHSRCFLLCLLPSLGPLGWRQPNHLVLLVVFAKTLAGVLRREHYRWRMWQSRHWPRQVFRRASICFPCYMVAHLADRGTRRLTWLSG